MSCEHLAREYEATGTRAHQLHEANRHKLAPTPLRIKQG
jgi:hypothetical protein